MGAGFWLDPVLLHETLHSRPGCRPEILCKEFGGYTLARKDYIHSGSLILPTDREGVNREKLTVKKIIK